jgi:hypothetical protein
MDPEHERMCSVLALMPRDARLALVAPWRVGLSVPVLCFHKPFISDSVQLEAQTPFPFGINFVLPPVFSGLAHYTTSFT